MVRVSVNLPGVFKVTSKGRVYWYAWRGGPRLRGEPGEAAFAASYHEAHEQHRRPDDRQFRAVITLYKASGDYRDLAESTRRNWGPWLDKITDYFGALRTAQFDRPDKIRPLIRRWRNGYADKPRSADYGLQVLSRVLAYAVDPLGRIGMNPCEGIKGLYSVDRSERIWADADIARFKAGGPPELGHAIDLAAATGLRFGDLVKLSWSHVGDDAIVIVTGKSKSKVRRRREREAVVPLYDDLRALLAQIPKRSTAVLTNTRHRPWTEQGLQAAISRAKARAGMKSDDDLNWHDLRGSAATRLYTAGLSERVIAEIMGWEEEHVSRIIRRYVGRSAATKAAILQLNQTQRRT